MANQFESRWNDLKTKSPASELTTREKALSFYNLQGLPTRKNEDWKYTNVSFLDKQVWSDPESSVKDSLDKIKGELHSEFHHLIFFNGVFQPQLSDQIEGLKVEKKPLKKEQFDNAVTALNWAFTPEALSLSVDKDVKISRPVQILHFAKSSNPSINFPHIEVQVGVGGCLCLIEQFMGENTTATNSLLAVKAEKNSRFTYIHVQEQDKTSYHLADTHYDVAEGAHIETLSYTTGALLSRHTQKYSLNESHSHVRSLGLYLVSGKQHTDHTGRIDHVVGECTSYQIYKGLLDGQGRAVFNGQVYIRPNSQKAFSEQVNKNLMLSSEAEVDSKPQLEIYADDVQARHGSTVGQLNKEELFYLNSRAIPTEKALPLLSFGFLSEIIYQLSEEKVIDWLKPKLEKALALLQTEKR